MEKLQKLTKTDFEDFKKECQQWIDKLGLYDWNVKYEFKQIKNVSGRCVASYVASTAIIILSPDFIDCPITDKKTHIEETALHEVLELVLFPLTILVEDRSYDEGEVTHQTHRIIQRLMKFLK